MQCLGVEPVVEPGDLVPRWPGGETAGESDSLPAPTGFLKKHNTIGILYSEKPYVIQLMILEIVCLKD